MKALLKILFYINFISLISLTLGCNLRFSNQWLNEWSVLFTHDANNHFQLVRDQNVAPNQQIIMICNRNPQPVTTVNCMANNRFDQVLPPRNQCQQHQSPNVVRQQDPSAAHCPYTLYRIGFVYNNQFAEAYQVCFDHKHLRPVFTINTAYPVGGGRPQTLQFNPDNIFYGNYFHAFDRKVTVRRFNQLLGSSQTYNDINNFNHIIDRGHLTPSADFGLSSLKAATFEMINVMPQFKSVDDGNWRKIEEWTRDRSRTPAHVCTGVLDCNLDGNSATDLNCVVHLQDQRRNWVPIFLANNKKIPIPLWSYKIVKSKTDTLAFLTLNNIHHQGNVSPPPGACQQIPCPLTLSPNIQEGPTFCCSHDEFIRQNVPHLSGIC